MLLLGQMVNAVAFHLSIMITITLCASGKFLLYKFIAEAAIVYTLLLVFCIVGFNKLERIPSRWIYRSQSGQYVPISATQILLS